MLSVIVLWKETGTNVWCVRRNVISLHDAASLAPYCTSVLCNFFRQFLLILSYIQGVTGGTDQTSGECFLRQTIPI